MGMNFTEEALELWNQLEEDEKEKWTTQLFCQKCNAEINVEDINVSIHEEQLALFHKCKQCENKEVRLIDVGLQDQKAIDHDFEQWVKSKKAAHPERFKDD
ncbi:MAG: hypothetical protein GY866_02595 [Proteobacteria bacterium]|nr:hypothetical protein [Pseudomonadota bacterium]